jgi:hypothetical protein
MGENKLSLVYGVSTTSGSIRDNENRSKSPLSFSEKAWDCVVDWVVKDTRKQDYNKLF